MTAVLPFPDVPARPLRAVHVPVRYHVDPCADAWMWLPANKWSDAQRRRATMQDGPTYVYTPDCPGCNDLIAWHQEGNARARRNAR